MFEIKSCIVTSTLALLGHLKRQFKKETASDCPSLNWSEWESSCFWKCPPCGLKDLGHAFSIVSRHWLSSEVWSLVIDSPITFFAEIEVSWCHPHFWLVLSRFFTTVWCLVGRNPDLNSSDWLIAVQRSGISRLNVCPLLQFLLQSFPSIFQDGILL